MYIPIRVLLACALGAGIAFPAAAACLRINTPGPHTITGDLGNDCLLLSAGVSPLPRFDILDGRYQSLQLQDVEAHLYGGTIGGRAAGNFTKSSIYMRGGSLAIHGGTILPNTQTFSIEIDREAPSAVVLHGYGFQIDPYTANSFITQARGWLTDRTYVELTISRMADEPVEGYPITAVEEQFPFDPDSDGDFDIEDLNFVRNNFGGPLGDLNGDGVVGVVELNTVRNFFGAPATEFQPTPEPSTLALAVMLGLALCGKFRPRPRRSFHNAT